VDVDEGNVLGPFGGCYFINSVRGRVVLESMEKGNTHCKENTIYVFLFWELRGLSPKISTFICLGAIYIFPGSVHIFPAAE
jgi:hypothetical protein